MTVNVNHRRRGRGRRAQVTAALSLILAAAFGACQQEASFPRDAREAGWVPRFDDFETAADTNRFIEHEDRLEVKYGSNVSLWPPDCQATGEYRLALPVTHLDSGLHPHGAGLTFGGTDTGGDNQRYTYFLVRNDQSFLIKGRNGTESTDIVPWTKHDAVAVDDEEGHMHNVLEVTVQGDEVVFAINKQVVHRQPQADLAVDGQYGVRLVHDIHVVFGYPEATPL